MKNMIFAALNLLLALSISTFPMKAQSLCAPNQTSHVVGIKRLSYGSPVTLTYQEDTSVLLSTDSGGNALNGKVALEARPSDSVHYWQDAASPPDVSSILLEGENTITLLGDEGTVFWLITESPCPVQIAEVQGPAPKPRCHCTEARQ